MCQCLKSSLLILLFSAALEKLYLKASPSPNTAEKLIQSWMRGMSVLRCFCFSQGRVLLTVSIIACFFHYVNKVGVKCHFFFFIFSIRNILGNNCSLENSKLCCTAGVVSFTYLHKHIVFKTQCLYSQRKIILALKFWGRSKTKCCKAEAFPHFHKRKSMLNGGLVCPEESCIAYLLCYCLNCRTCFILTPLRYFHK